MSDMSIENSGDSSVESASGTEQLKFRQRQSEGKAKQSIPLAIIGGIVGVLVALCLWALITYTTRNLMMLYMPIIIGFIVGFAVRLLGKGNTFFFGLIGAIFSLSACFLGHFLALAAISASVRGASIFAVLYSFLSSEFDEEFIAESFSTLELGLFVIPILVGFFVSIYKNNKANIEKI